MRLRALVFLFVTTVVLICSACGSAEEGLTVTLSYKGDQLFTLGREAKSRISRLVTRTKALEINNLRKLIELAV